MITIHTVVRNEGNFIRQALLSVLVLKEVDKAFVWDTGSTDDTVNKIKSINDPRIELRKCGRVNRSELVILRNKQIQLTTTPWFLLVDGDEIWPRENLELLTRTMKQSSNETIALVNRTRNAVGNTNHFLPESEGKYQIGPWKGHLNIRAIRNLPGLQVKGSYPNEWYEIDRKKIQDQVDRLQFVNTWYLHLTHLKRSGNWLSEAQVIDRVKKHKWLYNLRGKKILQMKDEEIPSELK